VRTGQMHRASDNPSVGIPWGELDPSPEGLTDPQQGDGRWRPESNPGRSTSHEYVAAAKDSCNAAGGRFLKVPLSSGRCTPCPRGGGIRHPPEPASPSEACTEGALRRTGERPAPVETRSYTQAWPVRVRGRRPEIARRIDGQSASKPVELRVVRSPAGGEARWSIAHVVRKGGAP